MNPKAETTKHGNTPPTACCMCYDREQGKNGAIRREWLSEWAMFAPLCRKHSVECHDTHPTDKAREVEGISKTGDKLKEEE